MWVKALFPLLWTWTTSWDTCPGSRLCLLLKLARIGSVWSWSVGEATFQVSWVHMTGRPKGIFWSKIALGHTDSYVFVSDCVKAKSPRGTSEHHERVEGPAWPLGYHAKDQQDKYKQQRQKNHCGLIDSDRNLSFHVHQGSWPEYIFGIWENKTILNHSMPRFLCQISLAF